MKVLLLGATGLVGQFCLAQLLNSPAASEVIAPTRRSLQMLDRKLHNALVDFDRLDEYPELFDVDAILCCLGTTIKQAGSRDQFEKVDYEYCIEAAELGRTRCAKAFLLVSAVGASANSMVFYSRVKGKLESHLRSLEYPVLSIYRPSLLVGDRQQNRLGEELGGKLMGLLNPLLVGSMSQYRSIPAETVARAMVNECLQLESLSLKLPKVNLYTHQQIVKLAGV